MGRMPRMEEEGCIYHVIQRGNNKEFVFENDRDKEYLVSLFKLLVERGHLIYGFVIMGNHYHLVLRVHGELLQSAMQRLNLRYSKYFNHSHERSGHVFQGRYKAIPVRDERYLLSVLRYVHQNPVRAGICRMTDQYRWSSDYYYRKNKKEWVETGLVLNMFSAERKSALKGYSEFMAKEETGDYENTRVIGKISGEYTLAGSEKKLRKSLDEILLATGLNEQEFLLIKSGSRKRSLTGFKLAYAREAMKFDYTIKAIGENIKVSGAAILDLLTREQ